MAQHYFHAANHSRQPFGVTFSDSFQPIPSEGSVS
jgi:hypothetical protein